MKRLLNILCSFFAIIVFLPLMIALYVFIWVSTKENPIYTSTRVGKNWKKFKLYKFRTMNKGADKILLDLESMNSYVRVDDTEKAGEGKHYFLSNDLLYADNYKVREGIFLSEAQKCFAGTFIKIENDPRITKIGRFLRRTSFDELPQLFNILKGDMAIVGNRPLSVKEAELLTTDEEGIRFKASAGLTGLWQVDSRKDDMPPEERIRLDNEYAEKESLAFDVILIFKTVKRVIFGTNV